MVLHYFLVEQWKLITCPDWFLGKEQPADTAYTTTSNDNNNIGEESFMDDDNYTIRKKNEPNSDVSNVNIELGKYPPPTSNNTYYPNNYNYASSEPPSAGHQNHAVTHQQDDNNVL
jgi:hypothetical protein